jgi:hypothetical protein
MPGKINLRALPQLEGWLTFTQAAAELGISRQRFYQLAEDGKLQTATRLGERPTYIVRTAEVRALKLKRSGAAGGTLEVPLFHSTGGVVVTEEDLRQAVAILEGSAGSRGSFKQAMIKAGNPLAKSDYMGTARQHRMAHQEARRLSTKQVLLAAYRAELGVSQPERVPDEGLLQAV